MKKTFLFLTVFMSVAMAFTGCKKDDDDPESYLKAGDDKFILAKGDIVFEGTSQMSLDIYDYYISLYTSGLTYTSWDGSVGEYTGSGPLIQFRLHSTGTNKPANGEYQIETSEGNYCEGGAYEFDYSEPSGSVKEFNAGGVFTINISGDTYTIEFQGMDEYDIPVEIFYKGMLTYHDESDYFD